MCKNCKDAPSTYEEYCMKSACPDAYAEKARYCGNNKKNEAELEKYENALDVACGLINGDVFYGYDTDKIYSEIMEKDGACCSNDYRDFILDNLDFLLHGQTELR